MTNTQSRLSTRLISNGFNITTEERQYVASKDPVLYVPEFGYACNWFKIVEKKYERGVYWWTLPCGRTFAPIIFQDQLKWMVEEGYYHKDHYDMWMAVCMLLEMGWSFNESWQLPWYPSSFGLLIPGNVRQTIQRLTPARAYRESFDGFIDRRITEVDDSVSVTSDITNCTQLDAMFGWEANNVVMESTCIETAGERGMQLPENGNAEHPIDLTLFD